MLRFKATHCAGQLASIDQLLLRKPDRCVLSSLYEALSVRPSVGWSVRHAFVKFDVVDEEKGATRREHPPISKRGLAYPSVGEKNENEKLHEE